VRRIVSLWRLAIGATLLLSGCFGLACVLVPFIPFRRMRALITTRIARPLSRVVLAAVGVSVRVENGAEVDAAAPAIYALNHSSVLDLLAVMAVYPPAAVTIGKREILWIPFFGWAYVLSGSVLIDRKDHRGSIVALADACRTVKEHGLSIVIAPEGTRSPTGRLQPFKRGVVHLAKHTGYPVVPFLIEGAHRRWKLHSWDVEPGEITVRILPRIDTTAWTADSAATHADALHDLMAAALPEDQQPLP
jgi:putative phosphoserine phosphatase/1-acylglycerol-3-phosphate O-acyltransferase